MLQDRLAARRRKKNANLEKQRNMKKDQMQERIEKNLANSSQHMQSKNEMTQDALNKVIMQMKLDLPPEKIPGAVERLIADKHDKELADLNLKHFEQKTMELRENM